MLQYIRSLDHKTVILVVSVLILWIFARPLRWVITACLALWGVGFLIWSNPGAQRFLTALIN